MKKGVESVLEHHFNNHSLCGDWCRVKDLLGREKELAMLNYRSKNLNPIFYLQVKVLFEQFYTGLDKMLHAWDTNIVEGMNKFFTKFLPKDRTYALTVENSVRLYLAVMIDSIGYSETYKRIGEKGGFKICGTHQTMNESFDTQKSYRREYRKRKENKIIRMRNYYERMSTGREKQRLDNLKDLTYGSGMNGPFTEDMEPLGGIVTSKKRKRHTPKDPNVKCTHCGLTGHSRTNSKDCLKNKKNMTETMTGDSYQNVGVARVEGTCQCDIVVYMWMNSFVCV